jgi:hypothetical protein
MARHDGADSRGLEAGAHFLANRVERRQLGGAIAQALVHQAHSFLHAVQVVEQVAHQEEGDAQTQEGGEAGVDVQRDEREDERNREHLERGDVEKVVPQELHGRLPALVDGQGQEGQVEQAQSDEHADNAQSVSPAQLPEIPGVAHERGHDLPEGQGKEQDAGVEKGQCKPRARPRNLATAQEDPQQGRPGSHGVGERVRQNRDGRDDEDIVHRHARSGENREGKAPGETDQQREECDGGEVSRCERDQILQREAGERRSTQGKRPGVEGEGEALAGTLPAHSTDS